MCCIRRLLEDLHEEPIERPPQNTRGQPAQIALPTFADRYSAPLGNSYSKAQASITYVDVRKIKCDLDSFAFKQRGA